LIRLVSLAPELDGAEEYAEGALKHKEKNATLAKTFYDISLDEVKHVNLLHDEVKKMIEAHRREKGEPPQAMLAVYEYLHEKHIKKAAKIKMLQAEYRGIQ
jgi:sulfite reductase alpha subunit-like flavoprotein